MQAEHMSTTEPTIVKIPVAEIHDWNSFHAVFARVLGFPSFYGCNMNAWVDCLTYVDDPEDRMTTIYAAEGNILVLDLGACSDFARRCPEQYEAILSNVGFVNYRRMEAGAKPVLASFIL